MEDLLTVLIIAIGLSMDSLAVSIAAAPKCTKQKKLTFIRFAFILGFIQSTFTIAGWAAGAELAKHFQAYDHWIAFALLLIIGGKMLYDGIKHRVSENTAKINLNNVFVIAGLGVATSIDAAIVGFSLSFVGLNIWITSLIIMIVTFVFSYIGLYGGKFVRQNLKKTPIEIVGGVFLIAIGTKILIEHLVRGC